MNNKTAAMFGLDARIALAIFGALSVITGAALYSAIKNAKVTVLLSELQEVSKAYDSYFIDMKKELQLSTTESKYLLDLRPLVSSTQKGWHGPYLPYSIASEHALMQGNKKIIIAKLLDGNWPSTNVSDLNKFTCTLGTVGGNCYMWVSFYDIEDEDLVKGIDKKLDGSVDGKTGSLRWFTVPWDSKIYYYVFLKFRTQVVL